MKPSPLLRLYDFDYTVYDGDCSIDFFAYCLRRQPSLLKYLPSQVLHYCLFLLRLEDRDTFKSNFFKFLSSVHDAQRQVQLFWVKYDRKIKPWYLQKTHDLDVIVSASPDFLLRPLAAKLKVHTLIATDVNPKTGKIIGLNCRGKEKVTRIQQIFGDQQFAEAYTDNRADLPMLSLASKQFIVKGQKVTEYIPR